MPTVGKLIPNYVSASVALSFAGFLNGYDTGCIGAISQMEQFITTMGPLSAPMVGITVSVIMLTGVVPALLGGHIADRKGRLRVIFPGAMVFGAGAILQASSFSIGQFIVGRAISGAGQGVFLSNVSVYITEIAPSRRRGRLAAMPQFMAAFGVCIGYFGCYCTGASIKSSTAWRLPYVIPIIMSLWLAIVCRALPESPRWLLLHGRGPEALQALAILDFNMDEARRDFLNSAQEQPSLSNWQSFALLFRRAYLPRTLLALFILSMAQLSGIDAITYYAPIMFVQAGISKGGPSLVASGITSVMMLLISIPSFLLVDRWGRRTAVISGGLGLSAIMVLLGALYATGSVHSTGVARWVVIVCLSLFGMVFCATWGIVSKIYATEIQPGNTRAAGNSVGMAFSFFANWLVAFIAPILLAGSADGAYFFFGGMALIGVVVFVLFMPETRGRSLENIQDEFRHPNLEYLSRSLRLFASRRRSIPPSPSSDERIEMDPHQQTPTPTVVGSAARGLRINTTSV